MRRLIRAALEALYRRRVARAAASLDGCEYCGEPGDVFLDVTPNSRHVTAWLACWCCSVDAVRGGAVVLMGADGRPVTRGRY